MSTRTPLREAAPATGPPSARTQQRRYGALLILAAAAYITGLYVGSVRVALWWLAAAFLLDWLLVIRRSTSRATDPVPHAAHRWRGRALALIAGGLPVLSLPAPGWWWFAWISLVPLLLLLRCTSTQREAGIRGWWAGAGFIIATEYWLLPVAGPGLFVLACGLGLLWLPWGRAARRLLNEAPLAALVVLPAGWIAIEAVRSWQSLGGPWALLGTSQAGSPPMLGSAALGGVWLTGFLVVLVNTAVAGLLMGDRRRTHLTLAAAAVAALVIGPLWGAVRPALPTRGTYRVAVVQPGVMSGEAARLAREIQLTRSIAAEHPNLVVWGESSVGVDLATRPDVTRQLVALTRWVGADVLVNVDARRSDGSIEKTSVLITPNGPDGSYTKTRLVPFGEYIPLRQELGWLSAVSKAAKQNRGRGYGPVLLTADGRQVGPLICFESTFPDMSRREVQLGAHLIAYQTATTTFQGTWAQPQQAMASALRAAETGRPVVHAALTGVSTAYDASGHRQLWLTSGQRSATVLTLRLTGGRTPFDIAGDWVLALSAAILAVALLRAVGGARPYFQRDPS
jgi:apolipoprotein N-acyltransferase